MTDKHSPDRFAVSHVLLVTAGAVAMSLVLMATVLVVVAQIWTFFAPRRDLTSSDDLSNLLVSLDPTEPAHLLLSTALDDVWRTTGRSNPVSVVIVTSPEINAVSMGDGRFLLWEGLASLPRNAIDGVMAHETAHDLLRHSRKATGVREVVDFVADVLSILGRAEYDAEDTIKGWARNAVLPHYSRQQEHQADSLAVEILWAAGYDGVSTMAETLRLLLARYGNVGGGVLDYHPSLAERITVLEERRTNRKD